MQPCVTISLVPEARGGPFVFWDDLETSCQQAASLGFPAVEIFAPGPEALDLRDLLQRHSLSLAALGTGGGWVKHKLTLTASDPAVRARARQFIHQMTSVAARYGAAVIIGSMQGRFEGETTRAQALDHLRGGLEEIALAAPNVTILYEHLNRYETNLLNRVQDVVDFLSPLPENVKILADLFHMNIEEANLAEAIRLGGSRIGHVHFADSNRRPAGLGHTDFAPIFRALRDIHYTGFISAEALPYPDPQTAAAQTIRAFRQFA
jgi:sugar phosphate isomerase/epimerase